jgi:hypothetical protein
MLMSVLDAMLATTRDGDFSSSEVASIVGIFPVDEAHGHEP